MPNAERLEHQGGAVPTTLATDMTSGVTACLLAASTNWPTGSVGPFYIVIDPGETNEEKILATSRTSNQLNTLVRGADGTAASAHDLGATVMHVFSADEADAANALVNQFQIVTSSTRPASPTVGMKIYETDTGNELTYQGATDTWTPPWNTAWGLIGAGAALTTNGAANAGTATVFGYTFTAVANRYYRITLSYPNGVQVGAGQSSVILANGTSQLAIQVATEAAGVSPGAPLVYWATFSAGSVTVNFRTNTGATSFQISAGANAFALIEVEDVGPAGAPS